MIQIRDFHPMTNKTTRLATYLLLVLLTGVFVFQAYSIWVNNAHLQLYFLKTYGRIQSVERSEILVLGYHEAEYVRFLDAVIPLDAPVLLPGEDSGMFSEQSILQYYLFPRTIWPCNESCQSFAAEPGSFILAMDEFPSEALRGGRTLIPYPEGGRFSGVYAPADRAQAILAAGVPAIPDPEKYPLTTPIFDLLTLFLGVLPGVLLMLLLVRRPAWMEIGMFSMPIGFGTLSWLVFLANLLGWPISLVRVAILLGVLLVASATFLCLWRKRITPPAPPQPGVLLKRIRQEPVQMLLGLVLMGWFVLVLAISLGRAYSVYDDIVNWALKGYATAFQGDIWAGQVWGGHVLAYPMNLQLSITFFDLVDGDPVPGSKLLFPIYALVLLLGCLRFLRRYGVAPWIGLAAALGLFSMPLFFFHSTVGMANLPFTTLLILGVLTQIEGIEDGHPGRQLLAGLLYGLAAWTRPEGIGFSATFLTAVFLIDPLLLKSRLDGRAILRVAVPALAIPGIWLLLLGGRGLGSDQVGGALTSAFGAGTGDPGLFLQQILRSAWDFLRNPDQAGLIVPAGMILLIGGWILGRKAPSARVWSLFAMFLLATLLPVGMFVVAGFSEADFPAFLQQSLDRAMLPAVTLFWLAAVLAAGQILPSQEGTSQ